MQEEVMLIGSRLDIVEAIEGEAVVMESYIIHQR